MTSLQFVCASLLLGLTACNAALGLDDYQLVEERTLSSKPTKCKRNSDCATDGDAGAAALICEPVKGKCVSLLSEDCTTLTGDYEDDRAIFVGSLFSTEGPQAATNLQRQKSAALAVEQINEAGGIPAPDRAPPRPLVLVSCNETVDVTRAATHLADIGVKAIIGPNTSQDTMRASHDVTIPRQIAVLTPTGVASSIADLVDDDLTFQMIPTDVQRAPLMRQQIESLAAGLSSERSGPVKLGVIFRNDALGIGTQTSLNSLVLNGAPLTDAGNLGTNVQIDGYDFALPDQAELVAKYVAFAPDIIVLAGTAEAITQVMLPLEAAWQASHRPQYVLIDSVKVPELLTACNDDPDLRSRVRGTGIRPTPDSAAVYDGFKIDYQVRYSGESATTSGMGPAYDATFAVALALAATKDEPNITGSSIVRGLRRLSGGPQTIELGGTRVLAAFQALENDGRISGIGTFAPLEWNEDGTVLGSTIEMWCVGLAGSGMAAYQSSGLSFDVKEQLSSGEFTPCTPVAQ